MIRLLKEGDNMKIGIVGLGHVGSAMKELFPEAIVYDKYKNTKGTKEEINSCQAVFVCVPTPQNSDGSCDTTCVDEVLDWIESDVIIIRSTVPVGYTESKVKELNKKIVFQPEYYGETVDHPFANLKNRKWLVLGGEQTSSNLALKAYQTVYNSDIDIYFLSSNEAELAKYMENAYLALKVTFCNQMYDIAQAMKIDYNKVREAWARDPRITKSHTFVYEDDRGYGGSCLPKDVASLIYQAQKFGEDPTLLKTMRTINNKYRGHND